MTPTNVGDGKLAPPSEVIRPHSPNPDVYTHRTLQAGEVNEFLDHLATVFCVTKPNGAPGAPRGLFQDHWENDERRDLDGVVVSLDPEQVRSRPFLLLSGLFTCQNHEQGKIVSSVRVYVRDMVFTPATSIPCGAIGDVATQTSHRGKRLASRLMSMAEAYMATKGFPMAVLHAAPAAAGLYASLGWTKRVLEYHGVKVRAGELSGGGGQADGCRDAQFSNDGDVALLRALFGRVAGGVTGSFVRGPEAWRTWVEKSVNDTRKRVVRCMVGGSSRGEPVAYGFVEASVWDLDRIARGEDVGEVTVQVREFFVGRLEESTAPVTVGPVGAVEFVRSFEAVVKYALAKHGLTGLDVKLVVPGAILPFEVFDRAAEMDSKLPSWVSNAERREVVVDDAWMYKVLKPFEVIEEDGTKVRVEKVEDALPLFERPVGNFKGCEGVDCKRTLRSGFYKTDSF
ncbi:hypothetical protein HK101_003847 [Irineochytrium annulatum]|nr:hypothetical protein HK101_003847 [Irineochytrium annulatum]